MEELKQHFLQEHRWQCLRLRGGRRPRSNSSVRLSTREAERFFHSSADRSPLARTPSGHGCLARIRASGYGQKDPLIEYKNEAQATCSLEMMTNMRRNDLFDVHVPTSGAQGLNFRLFGVYELTFYHFVYKFFSDFGFERWRSLAVRFVCLSGMRELKVLELLAAHLYTSEAMIEPSSWLEGLELLARRSCKILV